MRSSSKLRHLALLVTLTVASCNQLAKMDIRNVCEKSWVLVYAHSAEGIGWAGNKKTLADDVLSGSEVKVTLLKNEESYQISVDNVHKRRDEVCAESLCHLANNGTHVHLDSPKRYMLVCTDGYVTIMNDAGETTVVQQSMYWYTKSLGEKAKPVYRHFIDGSRGYGALQNLWTAARTMRLRGVMRDRGYAFPMHNVAVAPTTGVVTGQNIKYIGQRINKKNQLTFYTPPYMWFSAWSSNGHRDNVRWRVDNGRSVGHNSDVVSLDWYADQCWRVVYQNDFQGYPEYGSVSDLINLVRSGHRLRVTIDDMTFEASNIRVSGKVLAAQLLDALVPAGWDPPNKYNINRNTAYHFVIAHTSGTVRNYEYLIGSSAQKSKETKKAMTWSVDTRPWTPLLKTEDQGRIADGNPNKLREAVEQGASIRVNVVLDDKSGDFLTEPHNLRVDETMNIVYAQAMNHVSDKKALTPDEYELQKKAFYWYLMISSEGDVRMSAWLVGENRLQYDERAPFANIAWYGNY